MPSIPILSGIFTDETSQFRTSYPVNFYAVPKDSGVSRGFLRPASGLEQFGTGPGLDRGGIEWRGVCYRVMGSKLVVISDAGVATILGDVGNDGQPVTMDYSFDRLSVSSANNLFYYDGITFTQVTDPDLGPVLDHIWIDGYFMTTDGENLVVTELLDPTAVDPLKYGSSEADPDPVTALLKIRNEAYALNRHTIEVFDNVGGELFPFARVEGAQIEKGTLGTHTACVFVESCAFLGGGRNEQISIYIAINARVTKIATHEIDQILEGYSLAELESAYLEARNEGSHDFLYVHLPDRTLVYDAGASQDMGTPVWIILTDGVEGFKKYRARYFTRCYGKWLCGDVRSNRVGCLTDKVSTIYGEDVRWEFATRVIYNEGTGVIFNEMELVGTPGNYQLGDDPYISTSYSLDGRKWSNERAIQPRTVGATEARLVWFGQGMMRNTRMQRFRGTSEAHMAFARLEARLEPLAY